jgi:hypothetical protein
VHLRIPAAGMTIAPYPFQPDKKLLTKSEKNVLSRCKKISMRTSEIARVIGTEKRQIRKRCLSRAGKKCSLFA